MSEQQLARRIGKQLFISQGDNSFGVGGGRADRVLSEPLRVPDELKVDFSAIPGQRELFSGIRITALRPQNLKTSLGIDVDHERKGRRIAMIGAGLDVSVFHLGTRGVIVDAVDPVYQSAEAVNAAREKIIEHNLDIPQVEREMFAQALQFASLNPKLLRELKKIDPEATARLTIQSADDFLERFQNQPDSRVHLIPAFADDLPLQTASVDRVISARCISAMSTLYDMLAASILEGLRIMRRGGIFEISPWMVREGHSFNGNPLNNAEDTDLSAEGKTVWDTNRAKIRTLLTLLGVSTKVESVENITYDAKLVLEHTAESFKRFQDYEALKAAVAKG